MIVGENYKGFKVLEIVDLSDYDSKGVYLRHEESGMEVFHIVNDDEENLFAYSFNTPAKDSTGVSHVMEHSVLCGSKKYPINDPFIQLSNQSVNTYLNAYTTADKTVFPASSFIKADFFNIFGVYTDAVFFPLLKYETFLQECHRLEIVDSNLNEGGDRSLKEEGGDRSLNNGDRSLRSLSSLSIQGVVYNEMKGAFSSFDYASSKAIDEEVLCQTNYVHNFGGYPLSIPSLTYQEFLDFHKRYYCLANCRLFLYGNIPTQEILDFVSTNVIAQVTDFGKKAEFPPINENITLNKFITKNVPCSDVKEKNACCKAWRIGKSIEQEDPQKLGIQLMFLDELLTGDDCAPLSKMLLDSNLGEDIASQSGIDISTRAYTFTFGLRGVEPKNVEKVNEIITESLEKICEQGINQDDIDRTCMAFEFSNKEIVRFHGPYSLILLRRSLRSWAYGHKPYECLSFTKTFDEIKNSIKTQKGYLENLIREYFIDNPNSTFVQVIPSVEEAKRIEEKEKQIALEQFNQLGKEKVLSDLDLMHENQNKIEDKSCIKHISVKDLDETVEICSLDKNKINDVDIYSCKEATNGIVYFHYLIPVDSLNVTQLMYLPLLAELITNIGFDGNSWDKSSNLIRKYTGGFVVHTTNFEVGKNGEKYRIKDKNRIGRTYFEISFKVLEEYFSQALEIFSKILFKSDFTDYKRIEDLFNGFFNDFTSSLGSHTHSLGSYRCSLKHCNRRDLSECLHGLTSYYFYKELKNKPIEEISLELKNIFEQLVNQGTLISLISTKDFYDEAQSIIKDFIQKNQILPLKKYKPFDYEQIKEMTDSVGIVNKECKNPLYDELIISGAKVGNSISVFPGFSYGSKEAVSAFIIANILETNQLWNEVRVVGGAYGVYFSHNATSEIFKYCTYRDPKPVNSYEVFNKISNELKNDMFTQEEIEKSVIGTYSSIKQPKTPFHKARTALYLELTGTSVEDRRNNIHYLLNCKMEDINKVLDYLKSIPKEQKSTVLVCPKELVSDNIIKNSGKILDLTL